MAGSLSSAAFVRPANYQGQENTIVSTITLSRKAKCSPLHTRNFCSPLVTSTISVDCPCTRQDVGYKRLSLDMRTGVDGVENWVPQLWRRINESFSTQQRGGVIAVASLPVAGFGGVQIAGVLFTFATVFVIPFYTTMILAPRWEWTEKLSKSNLPYVVLGALYVYLLIFCWTSETLHLLFASKYFLPELRGIARMFNSPISVASAWIHLLASDLFCGRHVFLDGLQHNVETRHSLVLCLMVCPVGIFSHLVTKAITLSLRRAAGGMTTYVLQTKPSDPYA